MQTDVRSFHLDNRAPGERAEFLNFWTEVLLSGASALITAEKISQEVVDGMTEELARVGRDPNSVFFYAFIKARARAWQVPTLVQLLQPQLQPVPRRPHAASYCRTCRC